MSFTLAELKRLLIANPDLAAENTEALKSLTGSSVSPAVRKLNPDAAKEITKPYDAADSLLAYIRTLAPDMSQPIRDLPFDRYRIDLAWPSSMLAVEVDGGQHAPGGGKHGTQSDYAKTRRLTMAGWTLLRFTAGEVRDNPIGVIDEIRSAFGA